LNSSFRTIGLLAKKYTAQICAFFALFAALVPFARIFFRLQIDYDEGWNIYAASLITQHKLLYPLRFDWITVNYPPISFFLCAKLYALTHDYLFTARTVSLLSVIASSFLVAAIVRALGGSKRSAIVSGFFCLGVFCANADYYVGMDDPQMLSHVFYLLGLLTYIYSRVGRKRLAGLALAAFIFTFAAFIKQNPIDFTLAALVDLAFLSLPLTLWFSACLVTFTTLGTVLALHFGGPYFLSEFFMPRSYSTVVVLEQIRDYFGPLLIPFLLAAFVAWKLRRSERQRVASIFLVISFLLGSYFSGGSGVSVNAFFSATFAMCILLGLLCEEFLGSKPGSAGWLSYAQLALSAWLLIPLALTGEINVVGTFKDMRISQSNFDQDIRILRNHPGPALCESLLECYTAGKSYVYDPFNATRLIHLGRLDDHVIISQLQRHNFAIIQLDELIDGKANPERFDHSISDAIQANYRIALNHRGAILYVPK
jgi:4-amino-4-deoxy-L-arabinose transferase-like glycosyltransferase